MDSLPLTSIAPKSYDVYTYQKEDINTLLTKLESAKPGTRLLYQLPTGGGKTVIFSEIAKFYIQNYNRRVVVLTHRLELCRQTSMVLKKSRHQKHGLYERAQAIPENTAGLLCSND